MAEKEIEFQGWVLDTAARFGWRAWHVPMPMRPVGGGKMVPEPRAAGLPDLILMHADPPRLIFAELKKEDGTVSEAQREFLTMAEGLRSALIDRLPGGGQGHVPVAAYVWRPSHRDLVTAILRGAAL